jgi:hypothetical protein
MASPLTPQPQPQPLPPPPPPPPLSLIQQQQIDALQQQLRDAQNYGAGCDDEVNRIDNIINQQGREMDAQRAELTKLQGIINKLKSEKEIYTVRYSELRASKSRSESKNNELEARKKALENEKLRLEAKIIENKRNLESKHRDEYNKLVEKSKGFERQLKIKNSDMAELREKYETLKQGNGDSNETLNKLENMNESLKRENESLKDKLQNMPRTMPQAMPQVMPQGNGDLLRELNQLKGENSELKETMQMSNLNVNNNPVEDNSNSLEVEKYKQLLRHKIEELTNEKNITKELEGTILDCNQKLRNLENANRNSAENNKLLLDNNTINRNNNKKLQSQNKKLSLELYKLKIKKSVKKMTKKKRAAKKKKTRGKKKQKGGNNSVKKDEFNEMVNYLNN